MEGMIGGAEDQPWSATRFEQSWMPDYEPTGAVDER